MQENKKSELWDPFFYKKFPGFDSILPFWESRQHDFVEHWPCIADFNQLAEKKKIPVRFIEQAADMRYETEIYQHRLVPTRLACWHDFFNNLTWLNFPLSKWAIIERGQQEKKLQSNQKRTPIQNVLAHFDECGIIFCSDNPYFFELLQSHAWKKIFWELRDEALKHCQPILFGHGMMEKALSPYIGMTAKTIFFEVPSSFLALTMEHKIATMDKILASYIASDKLPHSPKNLSPFPLLGWPGWETANTDSHYYDNTDYFRVKK